jgi:hypothetical protein
MSDPLVDLAAAGPDDVDVVMTLVVRPGFNDYVHWRIQRPDLSYENGTTDSFAEAVEEVKIWASKETT